MKTNTLIQKAMQNTFGVLSQITDTHIDVSSTERGAKNYATRHGYNIVTVRFKGGYIATKIAHKVNDKWVPLT